MTTGWEGEGTTDALTRCGSSVPTHLTITCSAAAKDEEDKAKLNLNKQQQQTQKSGCC